MFVSYAKTAAEFRDEAVEELRKLAAIRRRAAAARAIGQNERAREGARANELATFAAFLESVQFHDKKPEVFPSPDDFWPGGEAAKN